MKNIFCSIFFLSQIQSFTLFDFNSTSNTNSWRIVNDNVMGGKSKSKISLKNNKGVFEGIVSLENNGGFAMTQLDCKINDVKNFKKIVIDLKGDGRTYQFRIKASKYNIYSFVHVFKTTGKEQKIELFLKDFEPQFRGVKLDMPNFKKNTIEQVAILIGNKEEEKFKLQLNKIYLK